MKVLLTGSAGQLGQALIDALPEGVKLIRTSRHGGDGSLALDLSDATACRAAVGEHRPDWVLNAGAYTAVDKAESEPELAEAVNAGAPKAFASSLKEHGGRLLQISTDFVFNGQQGTPYSPDQPLDPLGVYGSSKANGEKAIQAVFGDDPRGLILRTSWVIGPVGKNFALTMLRLHRERDQLGVVADQVGCPSSTHNLASACWQCIRIAQEGDTELPRVMHWSDAGAASWYDVAVAVGRIGLELGLIDQPAQVNPITTADYPTPATRPGYSLLDCTISRKALQLDGEHWQKALQTIFERVHSATG
jgi:dTDP-4-dehydrorhamnose reductase